MSRTALAIALMIIAIALGGTATILITHHPYVTSVDLGEDTADAKTSFRSCRRMPHGRSNSSRANTSHWNDASARLAFGNDNESWPWKIQHEVLLLEARSWWHTHILASQFSDLEFGQVEVGKTVEGRDAVVWSYYIKCGSCHGGPNGVLAWASNNTYLWNEKWYDAFSGTVNAKLPADGYPDTPASLAWVNGRTELGYDAAVYGPEDANCCPTAGRVIADLAVKDGHVALDDAFTFVPSTK